jgi:DNA-binding NarL/FixJ family response regulator
MKRKKASTSVDSPFDRLDRAWNPAPRGIVPAQPTSLPAAGDEPPTASTVTPNGAGAGIVLAASSRDGINVRCLRALQPSEGRYHVHIASLDCAEGLEQLLHSLMPRLLFIDVELCTLIGPAATRHLRHLRPKTDWVLVWPAPSPRWYDTVLNTHARGGIAWDIGATELHRAIDALLAGELWFPRTVMRALYDSLLCATCATPGCDMTPGTRGKSIGVLTSRESESVMLMRQGLTNKEIAARLGISVNTVKKRLSSAFGKQGLRSRRQVIG